MNGDVATKGGNFTNFSAACHTRFESIEIKFSRLFDPIWLYQNERKNTGMYLHEFSEKFYPRHWYVIC